MGFIVKAIEYQAEIITERDDVEIEAKEQCKTCRSHYDVAGATQFKKDAVEKMKPNVGGAIRLIR